MSDNLIEPKVGEIWEIEGKKVKIIEWNDPEHIKNYGEDVGPASKSLTYRNKYYVAGKYMDTKNFYQSTNGWYSDDIHDFYERLNPKKLLTIEQLLIELVI